jgi:alkyl hydroperoxide reductase 1
MVLQAGDKFPEGVKFGWAPILDEDPTVCGIPQLYDANKEWAGKKVVIVAVPGMSTQSVLDLPMSASLSHVQL